MKKYKHDKALFRFTTLKYEVQLYMAKEFESFNEKDREEFKKLIDEINATIRYYEELKLSLFNFGTFKQLARDVIHDIKALEATNFKSKRIIQFRYKIGRAYLLAFTDLVFLFKIRALSYLSYQLFVKLKVNKKFNALWLWVDEATRKYKLEDRIKLSGA